VPASVLAAAEPRALPPPDAVDLAVYARGLSASRVAARIVAAAALTTSLPEGEPADEERLRELGRELGRELASRPRTAPFRFVVEALDEARNADQANLDEPRRIALLLAALAKQAGAQTVRSLVGTRPRSPRPGESMGGDLLCALGTDPDDGTTTVDLGRHPYLDRPAISRYVRRLLAGTGEATPPASAPLSERQRARLADTIAQAAGDNFLVALLTALAVRDAPDRAIAYPETIGDAFDLYLDNFGARRARVETLFRALAYAEGEGLATSDPAWLLIASAVGDRGVRSAAAEREHPAELDAFVSADAAYLVQAGARERRRRGLTERVLLYRLYHQAITDHLRATDYERRQQEIVHAFYDSVPGEERPDWQAADPYVLRYLLRHALAGGERSQLDALLEDPAYCVHADPRAFEPRLILRAHSRQAVAAAHTIGRASDGLRTADGPQERAAQLGLSARQSGYTWLADRFDRELERLCDALAPARSRRLPFNWRCRWAIANPESPNFVLPGHTDWVSSVAVGTLAGEEVIVSGSGDRTVRVWAADGSPRGEPLQGHTGVVSAVAVGTLAGEHVTSPAPTTGRCASGQPTAARAASPSRATPARSTRSRSAPSPARM
jgi:hypothetical protein